MRNWDELRTKSINYFIDFKLLETVTIAKKAMKKKHKNEIFFLENTTKNVLVRTEQEKKREEKNK